MASRIFNLWICHKFEARVRNIGVGTLMFIFMDHFNIPAGHQTIMSRSCDDTRHLIRILSIWEDPGDRFNMIAPHWPISDSAITIKILTVDNFERAISHSSTNLCFGIDTNFLDNFLLKLFLNNMLGNICHIIIQKDFAWSYKNNVVPHFWWIFPLSAQTVFIKEYNIFYLASIRILLSYQWAIVPETQAEWFYENFLFVVPKTECIVLVYHSYPFLNRMHCKQFCPVPLIHIAIEYHFDLWCHLPASFSDSIINKICALGQSTEVIIIYTIKKEKVLKMHSYNLEPYSN